jgi:hypothetical protein
MTRDRGPLRLPLLLGRAIAKTWPDLATKLFNTYRPEKHYMRGPGPRSLGLIGDRLRVHSEDIVQEPLPEQWHSLMQLLHDQEKPPGELPPDGMRQPSTTIPNPKSPRR